MFEASMFAIPILSMLATVTVSGLKVLASVQIVKWAIKTLHYLMDMTSFHYNMKFFGTHSMD